MKIASLYRESAKAGLVYAPDKNALSRARRAFKRNLQEPGDCAGDVPLLAGLAIAQADIGMSPGWIPEVQRIGVAIAKLAEQPIE